MSKPYQDICDDLVQVAVRFEMARREHERALAECARVRRQLPPGVPMTPRHTASLDLAIALEIRLRRELAEREAAYKEAAGVITRALEERSAAMTGMVAQ